MKRRQSGLTTVEFSIVGPVALLILLGCIETGRMLFVWNTAVEATRRGARVATVVTPDNAGLATIQTAVTSFGNAAELKTANVTVKYYDAAGAETAVSNDIQYVTVSTTGVSHKFMFGIFGLFPSGIDLPAFTTTLPRESLGYVPPP